MNHKAAAGTQPQPAQTGHEIRPTNDEALAN